MAGPLLFGGASGSYGASRSSTSPGSATGGVDLEAIERAGRRVSLIQQYAPDLIYGNTAGALALAESATDDDEMLRSAIGTQNFASIESLGRNLLAEDAEVQAQIYASLPTPVAEALNQLGYKAPDPEQFKEKKSRFGINLPDFLPGPDELTLPDSTPVLGPILGGVQHALGEGLETGAQLVGKALTPFAWAGAQGARYWRMNEILRQQGKAPILGGAFQMAQSGISSIFGGGEDPKFPSPGDIADAWDKSSPDYGYIRSANQERALDLLGGDTELAGIAKGFAMGKTPDEIISDAGYEPGSREAIEMGLRIVQIQAEPDFQDAVHEMSVGQISFGRAFAQDIFRLDDTDAGLGRLMSGILDGGFAIVTDPTLVAGTATKSYRFGRHAFMLETQGDINRMTRAAQLADNLAAARVQKPPPFTLGDVTAREMRHAQGVLNWADRVSDGFKSNDLASLGRELPNTATSLDTMWQHHQARLLDPTKGLPLNTPEGVLKWLQSRDGVLSLAASRLGGASPMTRGLRMPTLTEAQKRIARARGVWNQAIDWSRVQYGPKLGEVSGAVGEVGLQRATGKWVLGHTAGNTGRLLAALTSHTPYKDYLPLYGDDAVEEYSRLLNMGLYAGVDRGTMDAYLNSFIQGDFNTRSKLVTTYLHDVFAASGIDDLEWAKKFTDRTTQAYAVDAGGDLVDLGGVMTRSATLVDGHHADLMAIPKMREFLQQTKRVNVLRYMTNNVPASQLDAALGRYWKPSVLMRLGFIPRAAGEELLAWVLKHGGRSYLGAKGAQWQVQEAINADYRARILELEALGQTDQVTRLRHALAEGEAGLMAPVRSLMGATDRFFAAIFDTNAVEMSNLRRRFHEKSKLLSEDNLVTGFEKFADDLTLRATGIAHRIATRTGVTRGDVGRWMAERWNPHASLGARLLLSDDRVMRAYAEQIAGSTYTPWEFITKTGQNGAKLPSVHIYERTTGQPVVRELQLRPSGEWDNFTVEASDGDLSSYYNSIYSRMNRVKGDRVGNSVLEHVLPSFVGDWGDDVAVRLGTESATDLRAKLNDLWAAATDEDPELGRKMLSAARKIVDDPETGYGLRVWLGKQADEVGGIDGRKLSAFLADPTTPRQQVHWLLYENVDPNSLINDFGRLQGKAVRRAQRRLARPDMYRKLREMRLYASDERMARPVTNGFAKVYVPTIPVNTPIEISDDLLASISDRIRYLGYASDEADAIAQNFIDGLTQAQQAVQTHGLTGYVPASAWGTADPRVADAVLDALSARGARGRHGILEITDKDALAASNPRRAAGVRTHVRRPAPVPAGGEPLPPLPGEGKPISARYTTDYAIDDWRLIHTRSTEHGRRQVRLEIAGDWWDENDLEQATLAWARPAEQGWARVWSNDLQTWTDDVAATDQTFWFADVPEAALAPYRTAQGITAPQGFFDDYVTHRLPFNPDSRVGGQWPVFQREYAEGIGEIEALEKVGNATQGEIFDLFTTLKRQELDDDVLHEVVEPMLRPDHVMVDEITGAKTIDYAFGYDQLIRNVDNRRLPRETYGPKLVASRDLKWDKVVKNWFEGPVDHAISSIIRKPMFISNFGQQVQSQRALVDLFVDDDLAEGATRLGLTGAKETRRATDEELLADHFAINGKQLLDKGADDGQIIDLYETVTGRAGTLGDGDISLLKEFIGQRARGLETVRSNALRRAIETTTPYIDDHRIRSAFQNYIGNFMPFQFAEEQFLKRWVRNVVESPEIIRKAQLGMNGIRSMGVIRKDERGNEVFVYPLMGEAVAAMANALAPIFGEQMRMPYVGAMTGQVQYTLPGLGARFGVPSVGPLIAMPLEVLSRHFPELADIEQHVSGPGADRPVWSYFTPSWAGRIWESVMGTYDKGALASATLQAAQALTVAGYAPPENATPEQQQDFIERVQANARTIMLARGLLGMAAPASPEFRTEADDLNAEWVQLLRTAPSADEATQTFIALHPDMDPTDLMASTVFTSESEYPGLPTPTDETFGWIRENQNLVEAFPAASPWLLPRSGADSDEFSYRAWAQQVAVGLRKRKALPDFVNDMRFAAASGTYFTQKQAYDAGLVTAVGQERSDLTAQWNSWKAAYFRQHPVFAAMLEDPTRQQRRQQAVEQLEVLSASGDDSPVPEELRGFVRAYRDYQFQIAGLRGQRTAAAQAARRNATDTFATEAQWRVNRNPWLADFYLRIVVPEIRGLDDDGVLAGRAA